VEQISSFPLLILVIGTTIAASLILKMQLKRIFIPPLIGYIILGIILRYAHTSLGILNGDIFTGFELLADIGIVILLFQVGLNSNVSSLVKQLPRAFKVWFWNVFVSGVLGFITSYYVLHFSFIPSLFVATALTATSVGVTVAIWKEEKILKTKNGQLLLDVAELDDISSIILLALLVAFIPVLHTNSDFPTFASMISAAGEIILTLLSFGAICIIFSLYLEKPLSKFIRKREKDHELMLIISGVAFIIAASAELLGLSLAIGAFFAGLAFSRDAKAVRETVSYTSLYEFFTPFFFINIGLDIDASAFSDMLLPGVILLIAAIIGKVAGAGFGALGYTTTSGALMIGVGMVPRAEIAMIVMQKGLTFGDWAVSPEVFSTMVIVTAGTTIFTPLLVRWLRRRKS